MTLGQIIASGDIFTMTMKLTQNILFNGYDIYDELHKMVNNWRWGYYL